MQNVSPFNGVKFKGKFRGGEIDLEETELNQKTLTVIRYFAKDKLIYNIYIKNSTPCIFQLGIFILIFCH